MFPLPFANLEEFARRIGGGGGRRFIDAWQRFVQACAANPALWMRVAQEAQQKQWQLLAGGDDKGNGQDPESRPDRRFAAPEWRENPFFDLLSRSYLVNCEAVRQMIEEVDLDEDDKRALRFLAEQYISALSPANFPATNPQVLAAAAQSGGESIARGMRKMAEDIKAGRMVANTDREAFQVGESLAAASGKVVLENRAMQLIEYAPQTAQVHARPLLLVPPCINKFYVLDLRPENSFVRALTAAGFRVFLVSWVNAGKGEADLGWDDYLRLGVIDAIDAARAISGAPKINALGFCVGGTLLVSALCVLAAKREAPVHSLTLLASLLDFSDPGDIGLFLDADAVAEYERRFGAGGLMPGRDMMHLFAALRSDDLIWPYVVGNYYRGEEPPAFDLLFWNSDSTNLPGPFFCEYVRRCYLENAIVKGESEMCGARVDPARLKLPVFAVACEKDHIVPWRGAYRSAAALGGPCDFVLAASGHIAGIVNPPQKKKGWHLQGGGARRLPADSDKWRETAKRAEGGWWPTYFRWLAAKSGKKIAAPKSCGDFRHPPREDAPGRYVRSPREIVEGERPLENVFPSGLGEWPGFAGEQPAPAARGADSDSHAATGKEQK